MNGYFLISLDYELIWGVNDKKSVNSYGANLRAVTNVVSQTLQMFSKFDIHATWATVGILLQEDIEDFKASFPEVLPEYDNSRLSSYNYFKNEIDNIGFNQNSDSCHWAFYSVKEILNSPNQELASHTYSHYYTLEPGQTIEAFESDTKAFSIKAKQFGLDIASIVFPRNQINPEYFRICLKYGLKCYRGAEQSYLWKPRNGSDLRLWIRLLRFVDAYISISGNNCYKMPSKNSGILLNFPSSAFLRAYNPKLSIFDSLKLFRIKRAMSYAAKTGTIYHLWWHPHNFGKHTASNFSFLEKILLHYDKLNHKYGFESLNMKELTNKVINRK